MWKIIPHPPRLPAGPFARLTAPGHTDHLLRDECHGMDYRWCVLLIMVWFRCRARQTASGTVLRPGTSGHIHNRPVRSMRHCSQFTTSSTGGPSIASVNGAEATHTSIPKYSTLPPIPDTHFTSVYAPKASTNPVKTTYHCTYIMFQTILNKSMVSVY